VQVVCAKAKAINAKENAKKCKSIAFSDLEVVIGPGQVLLVGRREERA
jgi:hypothetical protein